MVRGFGGSSEVPFRYVAANLWDKEVGVVSQFCLLFIAMRGYLGKVSLPFYATGQGQLVATGRLPPLLGPANCPGEVASEIWMRQVVKRGVGCR